MSVSVAMPKSSSFTCRVAGSYITLSGFRSRCTMPTACAACTASAICVTIVGDLVGRQRRVLLDVSLEQLALRPLDGEEVQARAGLADLDRPHHVGMLARARRSAPRGRSARPRSCPAAASRAAPSPRPHHASHARRERPPRSRPPRLRCGGCIQRSSDRSGSLSARREPNSRSGSGASDARYRMQRLDGAPFVRLPSDFLTKVQGVPI